MYGVVKLENLRLSAIQQESAKTILRQFILAGYPLGIGLAAVVNAKAESNLDPGAVGDNGASVGLFQLYDRGAGAGMALPRGPSGQPDPRDPRFSPTKNTARIIEEVKRYGGNLSAAHEAGASVAMLAGIFARDIERPANVELRMAEREALARTMFGPLADAPSRTLPSGWAMLPALLPVWLWAGAGVLGGLLVVGAVARSRRPSPRGRR